MRFKYANKHQELALGKYPTVSLHEARKMVDEARILLAKGINPSEEKREKKRAANVGDRAYLNHGGAAMALNVADIRSLKHKQANYLKSSHI